MQTLISRVSSDNAGFLISVELLLAATIIVLSMFIGLGEGTSSANHPEEIGSSIDIVPQPYDYSRLCSHRCFSTHASPCVDSRSSGIC